MTILTQVLVGDQADITLMLLTYTNYIADCLDKSIHRQPTLARRRGGLRFKRGRAEAFYASLRATYRGLLRFYR